MKRGSSRVKGEQSLLHFSETPDEHITSPSFSLCRCRKQAPVLKTSNICKSCQSHPLFQQLQSRSSQFTPTILIKPQEIQVTLQPAFSSPHTCTMFTNYFPLPMAFFHTGLPSLRSTYSILRPKPKCCYFNMAILQVMEFYSFLLYQ